MSEQKKPGFEFIDDKGAPNDPPAPPAPPPAQPPEAPKPETPVVDAKADIPVDVSVSQDGKIMVMVEIPHDFNLRVDYTTVLHFRAGAQRVEKWVADHWYAIANGVRYFEDKKPDVKKNVKSAK